jgi:hypothetical protein
MPERMKVDPERARRRALGAGLAVVACGAAVLAANAGPGLGGSAAGDLLMPLIGEALLLGATATCAARAVLVPGDRAAWAALALAIGCWTAGDAYRVVVSGDGPVRPYPSPADVAHLLFYPAAYTGLALLARARARSFRSLLWLDGLTGTIGMAALAISVLYPTVPQTGGDAAAVATHLAYPLGDALLLGLVAGVLAPCRWPPGRTWRLLGAGLALMAVADVVLVVASAHASLVAVLIGPASCLATLLLAAAAWQRDGDERRLAREGRRVLVVPLVFATIAVALLLYGQHGWVPVAGAALAALTLALVMFRTWLTFTENLRLLDTQRQAVTDELTGLANRRSMDRRLEGVLEERRRTGASAGLLVLDLDRFKELNDALATAPATCSPSSGPGSRAPCAMARSPAGWAATSSPSCSGRGRRAPASPMSPPGCTARSSARSRWRASASTCTRASVERSCPSTATTGRRCCAARTSPCMRPSTPARATSSIARSAISTREAGCGCSRSSGRRSPAGSSSSTTSPSAAWTTGAPPASRR